MHATAGILSSVVGSVAFRSAGKTSRPEPGKTEQKTCDAKESADAPLHNVPEFFQYSRERLLQFRHLFFHVSLNALALRRGQLWRTGSNYFSRRSGGLRRGSWSRRLFASRRRCSGADEPVRQAG